MNAHVRSAASALPHELNRVREIIEDPEWFPVGLDRRRGTIGFVHTDRAELARQAFLDGRWDRSGREHRELPFSACSESLPACARLGFIWHTAYCCSTVVARLIDARGINLSLREPEVLTNLADFKRARGGNAPAAVFRGVFALTARRFAAAERVTIKPSNIANILLPEAAAHTDGKALMLHSDCRSFLVAVVRGGEERRAHVRRVFEKIIGDSTTARRWPAEKLFGLSDLQVAALAWHMQISTLASAMAVMGPERTASLDCDAFLQDPPGALSATDSFFELNLGRARIAAAIDGASMTQNAKKPLEAFDVALRRDQWRWLDSPLKREIEAVVAWGDAAFHREASSPCLPRPLLTAEKRS